MPEPPLPVRDTVAAVAKLHAAHDAQATLLQRTVNAVKARLAKPAFLVSILAFVALWMGANTLLVLNNRPEFDERPYFWLQGLVSLSSLLITTLVLITQRYDDQIGARRDRLTLELALLGEAKNAKIIALLEELRRDLPLIADRIDDEAAAMSQPTDAAGFILGDPVQR